MRKAMAALVAAVLVSTSVATALLAISPASAHHGNVRDPRDTRGPLDVREVRTFGRERPGWRIITYQRWSNARTSGIAAASWCTSTPEATPAPIATSR